MSCSCHINPPCGWCEQTYYCDSCGRLCHPDEQGQNFDDENEEIYCDRCEGQRT